MKLDRLLRPRSIAYVGGRHLESAVRTCRRTGYEGALHIVNPMRDEIGGIACTSSIDALPSPPDAALVALSPTRSIEVVRQLADTGAGGAVVMSSGFREIGEGGAELQDELIAAAGTMPLLGPNCLGAINQFDGGSVWGDDVHAGRIAGRGCAIISQSGAFLIGIACVEQAFPLGYAISTGNQAQTGLAPCIEAALNDPRVAAIGLYLEGVEDGEALGKACWRAAGQGVPIIALKGGDGALGASVAESHTAALLVERHIWEAFTERYGILEVSSLKSLVETLKLLTVSGVPRGNRLTVVSFSGGLNGQAAKVADRLGLDLPPPTKSNSTSLRERMPLTVAVSNPMDMNLPYTSSNSISIADQDAMADAIGDLADQVADQVVFFLDVPRAGPERLDEPWLPGVWAMEAVRDRLGVPCAVSGILPEGLEPALREALHQKGIAALGGFSEAMEALSVASRLSKRAHGDGQCPPLLAVRNMVAGECAVVLLDEAEAKDKLRGYGIEIPDNRVASQKTAFELANELVPPFALKILSNQILHKARMGGVALNLDPKTLPKAIEQMASALGAHGIRTERFLIEQMVSDPVAEIIIGVKSVPAMGLAMLLGRGGSNVEAEASTETLLLPLEDCSLDEALQRIGHDTPALREAINAFATFAIDHADTLEAAEINPLILTKNGSAVAADAVIQLRGDHL